MGSLAPISPQRGHYHVIWSRGDTVCMESLGCLQGGADLTPSVPHPHKCLGTSDDSWQLLRRSTRAAEQRAGRVLYVPCGRTQIYSESHNREGHSQCTRAPFTVSCWPFSFMVSLFQTVPKCVLTDHQHVIWRLGFPLSLSSTAHSIYGLSSV